MRSEFASLVSAAVTPRRASGKLAIVALCLSLVGLCGCGTSGSSGEVVAEVGHSTITRRALSHWMQVAAGGDYNAVMGVGHVAPRGLVSDPPNYPACVAAVEAITGDAARAYRKPTHAGMMSKCRQLYRALREQGMSYLINAAWVAGQNAEHGVHVSAGEVEALFARVKARQFPTAAALQRYLAERGWSVSDELFVLKQDLLATRLEEVVTPREFIKLHGARAFGSLLEATKSKWVAQTTCRPGYVIEQCKEYEHPVGAPGFSPDVLLELIRDGR